VILQISSYWKPGQTVQINLLPHIALNEYLRTQQQQRPKSLLTTVMGELLTKQIAQVFCDWWGEQWKGNRPLNQYTVKDIEAMAAQFHIWQLLPAGTEGYRTAEVNIGRASCRERDAV